MKVRLTGKAAWQLGGPTPGRTEWAVVAFPSRMILGEYRGIKYRIASRRPCSGIGWTLLWENSPREDSAGAFYDDCPDHPEGAYAWAESAVKRRIDKIHETIETYVPAHLRLPAR